MVIIHQIKDINIFTKKILILKFSLSFSFNNDLPILIIGSIFREIDNIFSFLLRSYIKNHHIRSFVCLVGILILEKVHYPTIES